MEQFEQAFNDRVSQAVASLDALAGKAEQAKQSGQEAGRYAKAVEQVSELFSLPGYKPSEGDSQVLARLMGIGKALTEQAGTDRTEGDALAGQLQGMLQAGITVADEVRQAAGNAVTRWQQSNPGKRSGGSRAGAGQGNGVHVELKCSCGWVGHDSSNPNSARWLYLTHLEKNSQSHADVSVKPGKGQPDWQAITDAVTPVAKGEQGQGTAELSNGVKLVVTHA